MPAVSKKQQKFMGIVRSIQKGEQPASKFDKDAQDVAKDMKKKDVKKFASTKHKGLPMKKEILGKLKELIKQELSEYTYGVGDVVKDVNPTCPHFGAQGKVKSVNPKSVIFIVKNKGKNFKPGMELEKSHDQMKKMNESTARTDKSIGTKNYKGVGWFWPSALWKHYLRDTSDKGRKEVHDAWLKAGFEVKKNNRGIPGFDIKPSQKNKAMKIVDAIEKRIPIKESVNEMSVKTKKIISKLGKKEKEMFIDMVDMLGFDQVMADYKRDKKAFKQALKDMSESVIQERNDEVQTGKDYTKLWLQGIGLVTRQANGLKGALGKHPVKRDLNKLKAVETLFKRFVKPAIEKERADSRHYAPNQTELKKYLSNGKFKVAIRILRKTIQSSNGYDENSWYDLDDKTNKLIKKIDRVLYDIEEKLDKAQLENVNESMSPSQLKKMRDDFEKTGELPPHLKKFVKDVKILKKKHKVKNIVVPGLEWMSDMKENINEDGHTDVASSKRKVMIMVDDSNKLLNKLNGMNKEDSLPSWWSDKITLSQNYLEKATNYLLNPVESVNENLRQSDKKILMVIGRDFVQWMNSQFKSGLGKKEIRGLKQTLPNMLSVLGRPEDKRYNKFKSSMKHSPIRKHNDKLLARLSKGFDEISDYDKKVFVNTLMYNAGLAESITESKEPEVITQLRDIVKRKTNKKIKDPKTKKTMRVDMFTASAITQVYDAVKKTSHKSKFESLPLDKMAQLSFKMMK